MSELQFSGSGEYDTGKTEEVWQLGENDDTVNLQNFDDKLRIRDSPLI